MEKSIPRITVWHHEACQVMTNGDDEGQIFLSLPTNIQDSPRIKKMDYGQRIVLDAQM